MMLPSAHPSPLNTHLCFNILLIYVLFCTLSLYRSALLCASSLYVYIYLWIYVLIYTYMYILSLCIYRIVHIQDCSWCSLPRLLSLYTCTLEFLDWLPVLICTYMYILSLCIYRIGHDVLLRTSPCLLLERRGGGGGGRLAGARGIYF